MKYLDTYREFLQKYNTSPTSAEEIGRVMQEITDSYCTANIECAQALIEFNAKYKEIETSQDESGKMISSSKAKVVAEGSNESNAYIMKKAHLENCEQIINSLKSLQKGALNEYSHIGA